MIRSARVPLLSVAGSLCALGALGLVAGCGGGGSESGTSNGRLRVAITDQAGGTYAEVHIAVSEVRVVPAGDNGTQAGLPLIVAYDPPLDIDILTLQYQHEVLGQALIPAGDYNQVRLVLAPNEPGADPVNYLTLASDPATKIPLRTPSGQQSGLKILGQFSVDSGVLQTIVLDFNPDKAIVQAGNSGNYNLKPTGIRVVEVLNLPPGYGALAGTISPDTTWLTGHVQVVPTGAVTPVVAESDVDPGDGSFRLFVPPGDYDLIATADGYDAATFGPFTVAQAADTAVGDLALTATP
jgi:hypothetical protein